MSCPLVLISVAILLGQDPTSVLRLESILTKVHGILPASYLQVIPEYLSGNMVWCVLDPLACRISVHRFIKMSIVAHSRIDLVQFLLVFVVC